MYEKTDLKFDVVVEICRCLQTSRVLHLLFANLNEGLDDLSFKEVKVNTLFDQAPTISDFLSKISQRTPNFPSVSHRNSLAVQTTRDLLNRLSDEHSTPIPNVVERIREMVATIPEISDQNSFPPHEINTCADWAHDVFRFSLRIPSYIPPLAHHQDLLNEFIRSHIYIMAVMDGELPLVRSHRHYFAMLAASRHRAEYLTRTESRTFTFLDGDPFWMLHGPLSLPEKYSKVSIVNAIVAHSPWEIMEFPEIAHLSNFQGLTLNELLHMFLILVHFHSLSSFSLGLRITSDDYDMHFRSILDEPDPESQLPACFQISVPHPAIDRQEKKEATTEEISPSERILRLLSEPPSELEKYLSENPFARTVVSDEGELKKIMKQSPTLIPGFAAHLHETQSSSDVPDNLKNAYEDYPFKKPSKKLPFVRLGHLDESSLLVLEVLCPTFASVFKRYSSSLGEMTDFTIKHKTVRSTEHLRSAVWCYVHRLYGIEFEDYEYAHCNIFLPLHLKSYIKKLVCFPERICSNDVQRISLLSSNDIVQVTFLAAEARKYASWAWILEFLAKLVS